MRALRFAVPLVIVFGLVACGPEKDVTMPDVTGKKLDAAYDAIKEAGYEDKDKVEIEGGGTFGVVAEGNWTVCEQSPAAGEKVSGEPKLTVDRSCGEDSGEGDDEPSETPSEEPTPTAPATAELPDILTTKNSPEFAALLKLGDNCSGKISKFAKKYNDQKVRFNGSIQAMAPHGNYDTRFDFLIGAGDYDPNTAIGPSFQFRDKNIFDLNLTGKNIPDYIKVGQNYTFTAELGDYNPDTCLYQLTPVETKAR